MTKYLLRFFTIAFLTISLAACGFHLREQHPLPAKLHVIYIDSANPYGALTLQLVQILKSMDVTLVDDAKLAPVTLHIFGEDFASQVLSQSASSSTKQYVLYYTVQYELLNRQGTVIYPAKAINSQRNYTVNENQVLSTDTEQETLQTEMQRDTVFKLLMQLGSQDVANALTKVTP